MTDAEAPAGLCLIDLMALPDLPRQLREDGRFPRLPIVGFAPHVHVELLEAAREWCDESLPRGAVVSGFERLVRRLVVLPVDS